MLRKPWQNVSIKSSKILVFNYIHILNNALYETGSDGIKLLVK